MTKPSTLFSFFFFFFLATEILAQSAENDLELNRLDSLVMRNYADGNFKAALDFSEQQLKLVEAHYRDNDSIYASCLNITGAMYSFSSNFEMAEQMTLKAFDVQKRLYGPKSGKIAATINNLAVIYWQQNLFEKAEPLYVEALEIVRATKGKKHPNYVTALANLATVYTRMSRYEESLIWAKESVEIAKEVLGKEHQQYAISLRTLADCYLYLNRYEEAEAIYKEAYYLMMQQNPGHPFVAYVINNLGFVYIDTKQFDKAEVLLKEGARQLENSVGMENGNYTAILSNLVSVYEEKKDWTKATETAEKALGIKLKLFGKNSLPYATSLSSIANIQHKKGNHAASISLFLEVETILKTAIGTNHQMYVKSLHNLAEAYLDADSLNLAASYCQLALDYNKNETATASYQDSKWSEDAIASLQTLSKIYAKRAGAKNWAKALECQKIASRLLEQDKHKVRSKADKLQLFRAANRNATFGLHLVHQLWKEEKKVALMDDALHFMEHNKSILLADALKGQRLRSIGNVPDSILLKEEDLQKRLSKINKRLLQEKDADKWAGLNSKKIRTNADIEALHAFIKEAFPKYYAFKFSDRVIKTAEIQGHLQPNTALMEYIFGDSAFAILCLTKDDMNILVQPYHKIRFKADIANLRKGLSNYQFILENPDKAIETYAVAAHRIYEQMVAPALKDLEGIEELIIIPDNLLGHVPFEALLTENADQVSMDYAAYPYLLKKYKVSYNYSLSLWKENLEQNNNRKNNGKLFAMAASYDQKAIDSSQTSALRSMHLRNLRKGLMELPAAKTEVEGLAEIFEGQFYQSKATNEAAFKESAKDYGIIHLAMHGILNIQYPILSSLAFTENGDSLEDNFLQAYEISHLKLNADLVVLSACETGYGKFQQGEGVLSLARSFMYAGVPSMVVSLWQVNDHSTAFIMQAFYGQLAEGLDKAAALRQAKLDYIQVAKGKAAHPAFWAPFIQVGDSRPIQLHKKGGFAFLWGIIGLGLLGIVGFVYLRKRKNIESKMP